MKKILFLSVFVFSGSLWAQENSFQAGIQSVDEYCPAPGQFINTMPEYAEGDDAAAMAAKCTAYLASEVPEERGTVCLGAYGGYMTFHFDHPVANIAGERDFAIFGNSIRSNMFPDMLGGSSEPGIVMVSQDVNKNGLPDDAWYELSGSADTDSAASVSEALDWERRLIYNYSVTYRRNGDLQAVSWTDNQGATGEVPRMDTFHAQEYWPLWMTDDELTFEGTRLPRNGWYIQQGKYKKQWVYMFLDHGYADNQLNTDTLACAFDLGWAVDPVTREPVALSHADFFRVYTAMNQAFGNLGETSTEVSGAIDLHLEASVEAMQQTPDVTSISTPTLAPAVLYRFGTVVVERKADGTIRKRLCKPYKLGR